MWPKRYDEKGKHHDLAKLRLELAGLDSIRLLDSIRAKSRGIARNSMLSLAKMHVIILLSMSACLTW